MSRVRKRQVRGHYILYLQSKQLTITRKASDPSISICPYSVHFEKLSPSKNKNYPPIHLNHNKHLEIALVGLIMYP